MKTYSSKSASFLANYPQLPLFTKPQNEEKLLSSGSTAYKSSTKADYGWYVKSKDHRGADVLNAIMQVEHHTLLY